MDIDVNDNDIDRNGVLNRNKKKEFTAMMMKSNVYN